MGWRWEVSVWRKHPSTGLKYEWGLVYGGQSFFKALWHAYKAKRYMAGAIKVEWR